MQNVNDANSLIDLDNLVLDTYLRRIQGVPQLQSPQQFFGGTNFGGIFSGAATGASLGAQIAPFFQSKKTSTDIVEAIKPRMKP